MHLFAIATIIIDASKGGKPDSKPCHPCGSRNLYKTINQ
jgi:hypothetical protein